MWTSMASTWARAIDFKLYSAFCDVADACQVEAEVSERTNQFEASQSGLVISAVAGPGSQRLWNEADVRVVADGLDRQAGDVRHFSD